MGETQISLTYDAAGSLTQDGSADRDHKYVCDYSNRLIKVEHSDDYGEGTPSWSTVVEYYYDGLNRRVKKDLATGTDVIYLYDGWQVLEEREWDTNGEGAEDDKWEPRRQYVYGATYIDEVLIFDKDTDDDGDCVDGGGSSRHFYCQQANWNVVAVTDSSGDTDEKIKYDSYGEATVTVQGGHSATGNPYLFQSRRWDDEVDLYYFRNRVYSPVLGRFLQRDPIISVIVTNLYQYGLSVPTYYVDPFGLQASCPDTEPDPTENYPESVEDYAANGPPHWCEEGQGFWGVRWGSILHRGTCYRELGCGWFEWCQQCCYDKNNQLIGERGSLDLVSPGVGSDANGYCRYSIYRPPVHWLIDIPIGIGRGIVGAAAGPGRWIGRRVRGIIGIFGGGAETESPYCRVEKSW